MADTRSCGLDIADKMLFVKATQSLSLSESHRMSLLAGLNRNAYPFDLAALKDLSVRLLAPPNPDTEDIYANEQTMESQSAHEDEDEYLYLTKCNSRNRPGLEKASILVTSSTMNYPNAASNIQGSGKKGGKPGCFRCQENCHFARECHIPAPRITASPNGSNKGKGKPVRTGLLTESIKHASEPTTMPENETQQHFDPMSEDPQNSLCLESNHPVNV